MSHGKRKVLFTFPIAKLTSGVEAKHLTDEVVDQMEGVQNLRTAIYECVIRLLMAYTEYG